MFYLLCFHCIFPEFEATLNTNNDAERANWEAMQRGMAAKLGQTRLGTPTNRMLYCLLFSTLAASSGSWGTLSYTVTEACWTVMADAQKPDFVFRRNGRVHLNQRGRQFNRLLTADVCASAVVMLNTPCSKVVWRVLATHSIHQFPLHFPYRASPCAITFQLESIKIFSDAYCAVSQICYVAPKIKMHLSAPSVDRNIQIFR